ncbi:MAG TPA: DNA topoisomerase IV subunit A [Lentisphaeria bacterium]|nr:MAG: hypothetical protein A2X48_15830 [Lentisphaerae bacterium GWF2_49_21]HBC85903.1 DNA topoisomerase IV subunit A [Lentisphaeria bacterium]
MTKKENKDKKIKEPKQPKAKKHSEEEEIKKPASVEVEKTEEKPKEPEAEAKEPEVFVEDNIGPTAIPRSGNTHLRRLMDVNFLEYASYVIKDRAIPDVDDGLKPVQRRIMWSLKRMDDGKFHKVANIVGHTMQYHPHGDASIYEALVVVANKDYFLDKQGNFGNIFTGDVASAARYIECRLNNLAREVLYNNDITEFIDSYDGRNKEPVVLPVKVPALLMIGSEGIAVGMSTKILSHNFKELLEAQIKILEGGRFRIYPDFIQGGLMDVSDYDQGNGKVVLRARIEKAGRKLIIREIPAVTTTEKLIASIENAARRNKIKISSINDYTGKKLEIEITPARGYDPDKALNALYAYTDCSISVSTSLIVIADNKPVKMTIPEVLQRNTDKLLEYLKKELEIELGKLNEAFHDKTLAQIFIENRIYKRIEKCETYEKVLKEVHDGLKPFRKMLRRDVTDADIEKLLAIPIRRISLFDMNKNKKDIDDIVLQTEEVQKNLKRMKAFAIKYLNGLIEKYGKQFPRRTEIERFEKIDVREVALNNIKVGWDRKNGFVGTSVRSEDTVTCNEYDRLLCIESNGKYKVVNIAEKVFVGRLTYFCKFDKTQVFNVVYRDKKTGFAYAKRTSIGGFIADKEYNIAPDGSKIEIINARPNYVYECVFEPKPHQKQKSVILDFATVGMRTPKAKGFVIEKKRIVDYKFLGVSDGQGNIVQPGPENEEGATVAPVSPAPVAAPAVEPEKITAESDEEKAPQKEEKPKAAQKPEKKESPKASKGKKEKSKDDDELDFEPEEIVLSKREKPAKAEKPLKTKAAKPEPKSPARENISKPGPKAPKTAKTSKSGNEKAKHVPEKKRPGKDKPGKKVKGSKKGEPDDWGIAQPEFGF